MGILKIIFNILLIFGSLYALFQIKKGYAQRDKSVKEAYFIILLKKSVDFFDVLKNYFYLLFFYLLFLLKFISQPIVNFLNFFFSFIANLGDMLKAHRIVVSIFTFFMEKIGYFFWYLKKYWLYKPLRFFYIYISIYFLNLIPKNRDFGFEDTFFFRGYKLYSLKYSALQRRDFFMKGRLKIVTPEGFFWKHKKYSSNNNNEFIPTKNIDNFIYTKVFSNRNSTDISFFYNIWSNTKKGRYWFINKEIFLNFPRVIDFSLGTEFFRVSTYKAWKHSYINRLLYNAPYNKSLVAQRMLDYTLFPNNHIFSKKDSFSYFFSFSRSYNYKYYKGNDKLKLKNWLYSEKLLYNRDSQNAFPYEYSLRNSMSSYYAQISKLQQNNPYDEDFAKTFDFVKTIENFYPYKNNFFFFPYMQKIFETGDNIHDLLTKKTVQALSFHNIKLLRNFFTSTKIKKQSKMPFDDMIKTTWSNDRIFAFASHKYQKKGLDKNSWDSYFKDLIFYGPGPFQKFTPVIQNNISTINSPQKNKKKKIVGEYRMPYTNKDFIKIREKLFEKKQLNISNKKTKFNDLSHYIKKKQKKRKDFFYEDQEKQNYQTLSKNTTSPLEIWNLDPQNNDLNTNSYIMTRFLNQKSPYVYNNNKFLLSDLKKRKQILGLDYKASKKVSKYETFFSYPDNMMSTYFLNFPFFERADSGEYEEVPLNDLLKNYMNYDFEDVMKGYSLFESSDKEEIATVYTGPNSAKLYGFTVNDETEPEDLERLLFTNNMLSHFTFIKDPKYFDNDYYYQIYPALFNQSDPLHYYTEEFAGDRDQPEPDDEDEADPFFDLVLEFDLIPELFTEREIDDSSSLSESLRYFPYSFSQMAHPTRIFKSKNKEDFSTKLYTFHKRKQTSQDFNLPDYAFYSDSIRYSNILILDMLKKNYSEKEVIRDDFFFNTSSLIYDIKNYRLYHLYSKLFFEKKFREQNFYNSRTDRAYIQKEKTSTLTYPSGKLKSPTKYDYYFINKIGNRGFIDYKIASKFLNENPLVNLMKIKESKIFSYIWNEFPSNFIFVEIKYLLIDFFYNKCNFLNSTTCFTITRILLTMSDRILYELISAVKIYVISWISVLVDDVVGLYMRYSLLLLDHNTLLFISRKNVAYGSYTLVKTRDRTFENKRLFGLRDMRRRFYKGVNIYNMMEGPKKQMMESSNDIYHYNVFAKTYTRIRGSNVGVYEKFLSRKAKGSLRKKNILIDINSKRERKNHKYRQETKINSRFLTDSMTFNAIPYQTSAFNSRKLHSRPQNNNRQGFIVISRSKISFKPGRDFRFGKLYMKFRFRPIMLRFSNSTYFFKYKNLSSSVFIEYRKFPTMRRKYLDFYKYSDISYKSKNKTRNLKVLPREKIKNIFKNLYKNKSVLFSSLRFRHHEWDFLDRISNTNVLSLLYDLRIGFLSDIEKYFMVNSSYGVNDYLMRYSISFKFLNIKDNITFYNNDYFYNINIFDNYFLMTLPVNYKLRFVKINDLMLVDYLKWRKNYIKGHSAWMGENARIYNLDFYKNSILRKFKRHLKYKSRNFKIREIPYKINQRYTYSLYKNPFLKNNDSDFIRSLFKKNSEIKKLPLGGVILSDKYGGISFRSRKKKDLLKKRIFRGYKYLQYYINNMKKRKQNFQKIYFRTYNRNFYDYIRNFKTKKKPIYRVPLSFSYFGRKTLFYNKKKKHIRKFIHNLYKFARKVSTMDNYNTLNRLVIKRFISPIVSPFFVKTKNFFTFFNVNLNNYKNKSNFYFYDMKNNKDSVFSFFDMKQNFRFSILKNYRTVLNKRYRIPRRIVTFWNKNYFLKFRKLGYNNLVYRRRYKVRDNIFKLKKSRNKLKNLNYFLFNPRFWNSKGYDVLFTGFDVGYLFKKGHRSYLKNYQLLDLLRKRRSWILWKYNRYISENISDRFYLFQQAIDLTNHIYNKPFYTMSEFAKNKVKILNTFNNKKQGIFNILNYEVPKIISSNISEKTNKFLFQKRILANFISLKKKNFEYKNLLNKNFFFKIKLRKFNRTNLFTFNEIDNHNLQFISIDDPVEFITDEEEHERLSFARQIYFSFFFQKNFSEFKKNYNPSFLNMYKKKNISKKKAFLNIFDHLASYKIKINFQKPSTYRFFERKNYFFSFFKSDIQKIRFFFMSKFFFKFLNTYSDFIDFFARLQRESLFHKTFRKNSHIKFFFYRFYRRKFTNYFLTDKNYNYLNLIFARMFPKKSFFLDSKNDFFKFFLKYKRYNYNKHQYSRFRKPKYLSMIDTKKTYMNFLKTKKKLLDKNLLIKKNATYMKRMAKKHNLFLMELWNIVNIKSIKNKRRHKQMLKYLLKKKIPFKDTIGFEQIKDKLSKLIFDKTNSLSRKVSQKTKNYIIFKLLELKNSLIRQKIEIRKKKPNDYKMLEFIDEEIKKTKKKIIENFFSVSLDNFTIGYMEDSFDENDIPYGSLRNFSSKSHYTYPLSIVSLNYYNNFNSPDEFFNKLLKSSRNPALDEYPFSTNKRIEGHDDSFEENEFTTKFRSDFNYVLDKELFLNYNNRVSPFTWRNPKKASSNFKKNRMGIDQFFRRTLFNRRYASVLPVTKELISHETNQILNKHSEPYYNDWTNFSNFTRNKKTDSNTFINKAYPVKTLKHKNWSKKKFKRQKVFLLNFPKTKKYTGFQHLYNSRFSYNRYQKNYYRDRSLQNVVFDQNFKAQKFFEIIKSKTIRRRKIKHAKYNRARNIRSAIFETRLKTRFWLRNRYYNKSKKKPELLLDINVPDTYFNYTVLKEQNEFDFRDADYSQVLNLRKRFSTKKKKKLKFLNINKLLKKIPYFDDFLYKSTSYGNAYNSFPFLRNSESKLGLHYYVSSTEDFYGDNFQKNYDDSFEENEENEKSVEHIKDLISENIIYFTENDSDEKLSSIRNDNIISSDVEVPDEEMDEIETYGSEDNMEDLLQEDENIIYNFKGKAFKKLKKEEIPEDTPTESQQEIAKRWLPKIKQYRNIYGRNNIDLQRRTKQKTKSLYNYRSNLGLKRNKHILRLFYDLNLKNNVYFLPSLAFEEIMKEKEILEGNAFFSKISSKATAFFLKHSKMQEQLNSSYLFFLKYKSFIKDIVSSKNKKIKLAWYYLKNSQENFLMSRMLSSQVNSEKFGNFYIVDNNFTYGKKLNNYIAKNKLYHLDFDLLYDSRRFKNRYYRRKIPFKTVLSAKSHIEDFLTMSQYDAFFTWPGRNLNYMFGYPSLKNKQNLNFLKNNIKKDFSLDEKKHRLTIQNILTVSNMQESQNTDSREDDQLIPEEKNEMYNPFSFIAEDKAREENPDNDEMTVSKNFTLRNLDNWKDFGWSNEPRFQMNYKREHFKHYYFFSSKRKIYKDRFVRKMSKACVIRIDVLLFIHLFRGILYYLYRLFLVYLFSLKIFFFFSICFMFYKVFLFLWIKNVMPNLISLRNIYFLSNKLIERKFLNNFDDFYKEGNYFNNHYFLKNNNRIYKTDFFFKKKYFDRSNSELSFFYSNDKYFVRNFFFSYNKEYRKNFISIWVKGFLLTIKDTFLVGFFLFFFFFYRLIIICLNIILNLLFKYIVSEFILWFTHFANLFYKRIAYFGYNKVRFKFFVWNFIISILSFFFRKILGFLFFIIKFLFYFFIFVFFAIMIYNYLKFYNLTLTELPSTLLVLFLYIFWIFVFSMLFSNVKNLFVESKIHNIFPESLFSIGKEDNESALSPLFEMEHTYYPENHFIDYDKLMYSVTMDKALGATSDQNPSNYYLGSHLRSNYREKNFASFPFRYKTSFLRKLLYYLNPLKKSFRNEDFTPSMNVVAHRNYIIPNEISQKLTDSNSIRHFFYKSTITPILDIIRLTNVFFEKSLFLNIKQIYTLKFKFLHNYRAYYRQKNKKRKNLKMQVPNYIKQYWAQRIKISRKNSIESNKINVKIYENKIHKINNFNFFTYKNYQIIPKLLNPYKKYLILIYMIQYREYTRVQQIYTDFLKDIYYPFSYQDGILWDDLFDNFDFSNRSIWPSSDFGLFFQRKFREEFALKNRISEELTNTPQNDRDSNSLLFLLRNREYSPDYRNVYKRYKNSWFLDYDKVEYVKDIDRFEESIKIFTTKDINRIIGIFEENEDEGQSMIEEQHYLMDETDLSVYYDDHIFTIEDTSLIDYDKIAVYVNFINNLNKDLFKYRKTDFEYKRKAFNKVFLKEYSKYKLFSNKSNFEFFNQFLEEKLFFKNKKDKILKKVYKEYLLLKKNAKLKINNKDWTSKDFKYKYSIDKNVLENISKKKNYQSNLSFGIESGNFLYRGSFLDPRVSPMRLNNILKQANDVEFQDYNWFKDFLEKRILVNTSTNNETGNFFFQNNISMSDIDRVLFCDIRNKENGLGRISDYGADLLWDDHVWITSNSQFRNAVTDLILTVEKKYKIQYDVNVFKKNASNLYLNSSKKKMQLQNGKQKVSKLQYYKYDPMENVLQKKYVEDKVHSLDLENYRSRGQFIDFPTDFEALYKQFSFIPINQVLSINDIEISKFKIWFKEIFWFQLYDNRFKRLFFENLIEICNFLDLKHFPVLNLEEAERLWTYLGCTEEEWDLIEKEQVNITVPFGSDEIMFFFLITYFLNNVPTTNSVGHYRTMYGLENSTKIIIYFRNVTFYKIFDLLHEVFNSFITAIHWSKNLTDFLNLYKYPLEKISGTYMTYPYIPYNKFYNPFSKYWFNPQMLDYESFWSFQTYYINMHRNKYPNTNYHKRLSKVSWIDLKDEYIESFYNKRIENEVFFSRYSFNDILDNEKIFLPLHRIGPVRSYTMSKKNLIFFSNNSSEIGWNDRGFAMEYFQRFNSLSNLPQNKYSKIFRMPSIYDKYKGTKYHGLEGLIDNFTSSVNLFLYKFFWLKFKDIKTIPEVLKNNRELPVVDLKKKKNSFFYDYFVNGFTDLYYESYFHIYFVKNIPKFAKYIVTFPETTYVQLIRPFDLRDGIKYLNKKYSRFHDFFFFKTNSRRYSMLNGFSNDFFVSKRPFLIREKKKNMNYYFFGDFNLNITNIYNKMDSDVEDWVIAYQSDPNKFFNFMVLPSYKKYTVASYFPEPLLHTPSIPLTNYRSRILFNYDWFYIKCFFTVILSSYLLFSLFISPVFYVLSDLAHYVIIKILSFLSFFFSDLFIINLYNFLSFLFSSLKVNYLLLLKLYFLIFFDFFFYLFDFYFVFYLLKSFFIIIFMEIINIEYWFSILHFFINFIYMFTKNLIFFNFFDNFSFVFEQMHFFFEHFYTKNFDYRKIFFNVFNHGIEFFFIISSFFYYPYLYFPHIYISFIHFLMVFFHVFVNFFFVEYFTVYVILSDFKAYFLLLYDFIGDYGFTSTIIFRIYCLFNFIIIQLLLYILLIISFILFYLFYFIHMFFQLLSLFYVIYFYLT